MRSRKRTYPIIASVNIIVPLIYVAVVSSYPSIIKMTDWKAMTEPTERIVLTKNKRISVTRVAVAFS